MIMSFDKELDYDVAFEEHVTRGLDGYLGMRFNSWFFIYVLS